MYFEIVTTLKCWRFFGELHEVRWEESLVVSSEWIQADSNNATQAA